MRREQAVLEVDPQGKVPIAWSAADDYGLTAGHAGLAAPRQQRKSG